MPGAYGWVWNHYFNKWERVPACVTTIRLTDAGPVVGGPHKLHWISCNPAAGLSEWQLSDDTDGESAVVLEHFHTERESHNTNLVPPKQFTTGIWLKALDQMTSITFGYV